MDANSLFADFLEKCEVHIFETQSKHRAWPRKFRYLLRSLKNLKAQELTTRDALVNIVANPQLAERGAERLWRRVQARGVRPLSEKFHYFYERPESIYEYEAFSELYGIHDVLHDVMVVIRAAALNLEASRSIIIFVSHPGYSKTDFFRILIRLFEGEQYYVLKGCPNRDSPLWLVPRGLRTEFEDSFRVRIDYFAGEWDICRSCRARLIEEYDYDFLKFPVELFTVSERAGIGVATSDPKDPYQDSVVEFTGELELGKLATDPHAIVPGFFSIAQHGFLVLEEFTRRELEVLHSLISLTQTGESQAPGRLGKLSSDILVFATSNEETWSEFVNDPTNSLYLSRGLSRHWRRNIILDEEYKTIKKKLSQSTVPVGSIHFQPLGLELIGRVLTASALSGIDASDADDQELNNRIDLYNGARPQDVGMEALAWKMRAEKGDGRRPALSIRELKDTLDLIIAEQVLEYDIASVSTGDRYFCFPTTRVFNQILHYLSTADRLDEKLLKALKRFTQFTYDTIILPAIRRQLVDEVKLIETCKELFDTLLVTDTFDAELIDFLGGMSVDDFAKFKRSLTSYKDNPCVEKFITQQVFKSLVSGQLRDVAGDSRWCQICFQDALHVLEM